MNVPRELMARNLPAGWELRSSVLRKIRRHLINPRGEVIL
jgi:hypothetical protein